MQPSAPRTLRTSKTPSKIKNQEVEAFISKTDADRMRAKLQEESDARDEIIAATRALTKEAKLIIYAVHRDEHDQAAKRLEKLKTQITWLTRKVAVHPTFSSNASGAFEEYAEAACFHALMSQVPLPTSVGLNISTESYLLGLCDLTGELMREAVAAGTRQDTAEVKRLRAATEAIFGMFLQFDLRNGELRKKADAIKWNLLKIEQVLYDLNMRQ